MKFNTTPNHKGGSCNYLHDRHLLNKKTAIYDNGRPTKPLFVISTLYWRSLYRLVVLCIYFFMYGSPVSRGGHCRGCAPAGMRVLGEGRSNFDRKRCRRVKKGRRKLLRYSHIGWSAESLEIGWVCALVGMRWFNGNWVSVNLSF